MKLKPITLYCVIQKDKPKLSFYNLIQSCDKEEVRLKKGEKIVKVQVNVV